MKRYMRKNLDMESLPPSDNRRIIHESDDLLIYAEPYLDGWVTICEIDGQTEKTYPDGTRAFIKDNGEQLTVFPDKIYTLDVPGMPTAQATNRFSTEDLQ